MDGLHILKYTILTICSVLSAYEFIHIFQAVLKKGSYVAIKLLNFNTLISPSITLCPGK